MKTDSIWLSAQHPKHDFSLDIWKKGFAPQVLVVHLDSLDNESLRDWTIRVAFIEENGKAFELGKLAPSPANEDGTYRFSLQSWYESRDPQGPYMGADECKVRLSLENMKGEGKVQVKAVELSIQ